jgi:hypothetical protein
MVSHGAVVLTCFAWLLSLPSWGVMWRGYELWLIGEGTKPSDRRCPIRSHLMDRRGLRLSFHGEGGGGEALGIGDPRWC